MADSTGSSGNDRLDSWKEIAAHLRREIRTVQRWEKHEGLPVHRKLHDSLSSVYAYKSELDRWWMDGREPESVRRAPADARAPMLAVLPMRDHSSEAGQHYFADGVTEELISQIGRVAPGRLSVIASATAMHYKDSAKSPARIAAELKVRFLLTGSVRRAGDRIRTTVELVNAADQSQAWIETYDGNLTDILQLQTDIAHAVAERVLRTVLPASGGGKVNPEAYDQYMRARYLWNRRTEPELMRALEHFQDAIDLDPTFALPHTGLADCYSLLSSVQFAAMPPHEAMPKARTAAARALELDPMLAQAHASSALINLFYDWDLAAAGKSFERALELNPGYATGRQWYAEYLATREQLEDSFAELAKAQSLDPLSLVTRAAIEGTRYFQRRYEQVVELARATLEMEPNFALAYFNLGRAYVQLGKFREAIAGLEQAFELSGESSGFGMMLGYAHGMAGHRTRAQRMLEVLARRARRRYVPAFYFAAIYSGLRDVERAMTWLLKAREERCDYLLHLAHEPAADPVRSDPGFAALMPEVG